MASTGRQVDGQPRRLTVRLHKSAAIAACLTTFLLTACGGSAASPTITVTLAPTASAAPTTTPDSSTPSTAPTATPATTAGAVDQCSLLSADDVHAVLDGPWVEGVLTSTGGYCHWDNANSPNERVITALQEGTIESIKGAMAGGTDLTVDGHAAYSFRDEAAHVQTTYIDIGGQLLIVEIPMSSAADTDLESAQQLSAIAVGNL